jgi:putative transposase
MQYRRAYVPGGSYLFTVVTVNRRPLFADQANRYVLREAFRKIRRQHAFRVDAIVVLPDHLHCLWTLAAGDADFPPRWRLIKTWFTKHCDQALRDLCLSDGKKSNPGILQKRYWEHLIRDEEDYHQHVEYMLGNHQ